MQMMPFLMGHRREMRGDADRKRDDDEILDDVLAFECRSQKALPRQQPWMTRMVFSSPFSTRRHHERGRRVVTGLEIDSLVTWPDD